MEALHYYHVFDPLNNMVAVAFDAAAAAAAVYDVTQPATLENLGSKWMRDFKEYGRQDAVQMVVGNKIDVVSGRHVLLSGPGNFIY